MSSWTREEDKAFENAIALHWIEDDEESSWDKIASLIPSKSMEELKQHYQMLLEDVSAIVSGNIPVPNYGGEEATTSVSKESSSARASSSSGVSDKRLSSGHGNGGGFSALGHDSSGQGSKGGSRSDQERKKGIPWTEEEHRLFLLGLDKFGKGDWRSISRNFVISRTPTQVAAIAYFSLTRKGFKFQITSPLHVLHEILSPADTKATKNGALDEDGPVSETRTETIPVADRKSVASASAVKRDRILIPVALDSTQQEALTVLKKLKIIEDDVKADELCTRREYARWLVQINSSLERNAKHRLIPSVSLAGSEVAAFDDVSIEDPDFGSIQALAEAGVIPSKLSPKSSHGNNYFFPERFVSRQDLIDWKAHLEYDFSPGIIDQISTTIVGFMDVKEISPDASARLYTDLLAGEKSILRKVFGQCKRLQPNKPSTKAQAAVALTSGRISEPISAELMRLKAECSVRKAEMEVIRSELLDREDIQKFWDEKLNAEKTHGHEVEKAYHAALSNLEEEKIVQEKYSAELLKEKAAMDCQRQLLLSLKEEVNEMSEKLAAERSTYVAEKCSMQDVLSDLETKRESMLDQKSILEAEIEAVRILKSWIEDEARKSQARAKVLEEVGRRWKWDNQA